MPIVIEDYLVSDQVNTIDIYLSPILLPRELGRAVNDLQIGWDKPIVIPHTAGWGYGTKQNLVEYHYQDICYTYDLENDAQRAIRRNMIRDSTDGRFYIQAYQEESIPAHRMPAVRQIDARIQIRRAGFRINNRIHIHVDTEINDNSDVGRGHTYLYIRYHHAENVDTKKMQADLGGTIAKLRRLIYPDAR